jgi:adenylate cyclase
MLGVVRRAALPLEARSGGEATLSGAAVSRRLAAIPAADVAGRSRLMKAEETGTLARLKSLGRDGIQPRIGLPKGRSVETAGDGMLREFAAAVEAAPSAAG